jgi:hypothetical protein
MSLLLVDTVEAVVAEGRPVTARMVARRAGADVFRVEEILCGLVRRGRLQARPGAPRPNGKPSATLYVPPKPRRKAGGDDEPRAPLPGQMSFPIL